jgi:hypothetical protein
MMSKVKISVTALVTVVALSMVGSVAASAASWKIEGAALTGSAALSTQALVHIESLFLIPLLGVALACRGHFLDALKPQIYASDKGYAEALTFLGCNTVKPEKGCALAEENQSISTTALLALVATGAGEADKATLTPETKTTFASVAFNEADTCAFNGLEPVTGSLVVGLPTGQLELASQTVTDLGSAEGNNSLQIGGDKAFFEAGRVLIRLVSGSKWSFS